MIISARRTLSSVLQEKLLAKYSRQYHAPMKITFADNRHKFNFLTTSALYILNDWLYASAISRTFFKALVVVTLRRLIFPFSTEDDCTALMFRKKYTCSYWDYTQHFHRYHTRLSKVFLKATEFKARKTTGNTPTEKFVFY